MRITPKLALTSAALLMSIGLLWVGFVESGASQTNVSQGIGVAGKYPHQFIAAETMSDSAIFGLPRTGATQTPLQSKDNVPALALSGSAIAALVMLALAFARFQGVHPGTATSRRTRFATVAEAQI